MKTVIQKVTSASVTIDGEIRASIGKGMLLLLGVGENDTDADIPLLADKISVLRIFEDENGKMNLSSAAVGGAVPGISTFTR